jgi:hypothetical protein
MKSINQLTVLALLAGCSPSPEPFTQKNITEANPTNAAAFVRPSDFYLSSAHAISNALFFQAPPEGWDLVCDRNGHWCPRKGDHVWDIQDGYSTTSRTNEFEAIITAWRSKEIIDTPFQFHTPEVPHSTNVWQECK